MPPSPKKADELETLGYRLERVVWASLGTVDPKTHVACDTTNDKLVTVKAALTFHGDVKARGTTTRFVVTTKTGTTSIDWTFKVEKLPMTTKKIEYEAARQAFEPARVTCDVDGTELVPVGVPTAVTCWVAQTDNTSVAYRGGLDATGVITFRPVTPKPTTHTPTPTTSVSPSPVPAKD
jgi:hypothetical protein